MKHMHQLWTLKELIKMKTFKNVFTTKGNNLGLFFQLSFFALIAIMSLFSGQTLAQQIMTPTTTVTEGDLFPGGIASFGVSSGPGSVTIDHVNAGTGTQSLTVVGVPTNATVNIPAFTPGTFAPVVVTFTPIDPELPVDFRLRAASTFHAIFIRVRVSGPPPPCTTSTSTFSNNTRILIPRQRFTAPETRGPASLYPSTITVPALVGSVTKVTVTLNGLGHTFPDDVDVLLVGPPPFMANVLLMSDVGGADDAVSVTLTFDDTGAMLPDIGPLVSGTFKPTNFGVGVDPFPAPAPGGPYGISLSNFNGINAIGTWSLYIVDDALGDRGSLDSGWSLSITRLTCIFPPVGP